MLTMAQVENQIKSFSLEEQLHLLAYIANQANSKKTTTQSSAKKAIPKRQAGIGKDADFYMAPDFDATPDCFQEYM